MQVTVGSREVNAVNYVNQSGPNEPSMTMNPINSFEPLLNLVPYSFELTSDPHSFELPAQVTVGSGEVYAVNCVAYGDGIKKSLTLLYICIYIIYI